MEGKGREDGSGGEGRVSFFIFKHLAKRSWKISHGGPEKSWIFLLIKEWEPCY